MWSVSAKEADNVDHLHLQFRRRLLRCEIPGGDSTPDSHYFARDRGAPLIKGIGRVDFFIHDVWLSVLASTRTANQQTVTLVSVVVVVMVRVEKLKIVLVHVFIVLGVQLRIIG